MISLGSVKCRILHILCNHDEVPGDLDGAAPGLYCLHGPEGNVGADVGKVLVLEQQPGEYVSQNVELATYVPECVVEGTHLFEHLDVARILQIIQGILEHAHQGGMVGVYGDVGAAVGEVACVLQAKHHCP